MATVDMATGIGNGKAPSRYANTKVPYLVEVTLDLAAAATAKGSALAASDVIEVMDIPAEHVVVSAGFEVTEAMAGTSTDATVDLGVTGVDADVFVDGFDLDTASVGDYAAQAAAFAPVVVGGTADTIDLTIATQTGTITGGKLRVWALMVDLKDRVAPGLAALGS